MGKNSLISQDVSKRKRSKYTRRACTHCKLAHAKCGHERPCTRCVSMGRADECYDSERKKRSRRQRFDGDFYDLKMFIPKLRSLPEWDPNDPRMRPYDEIEEERELLNAQLQQEQLQQQSLQDFTTIDNKSYSEFDMSEISPESESKFEEHNDNIFVEPLQDFDDYLLLEEQGNYDYWDIKKSYLSKQENAPNDNMQTSDPESAIQDSLPQEPSKEDCNITEALSGVDLDTINPQIVQQFVLIYLKQRDEISKMRETIGYLQSMIANYYVIQSRNANSSPLPSPTVGNGNSFDNFSNW